MGITFRELYNSLLSWVPNLPPSKAQEIIKDSIIDIGNQKDWGYLFETTYLKTPDAINGTANVHEYNNVINVDSSIRTAIAALNPDDWDITERQIRCLNQTNANLAVWYNIAAYDSGTGNLTLDRPFLDVDNAAAQVQLLKVYYNPPIYAPFINGVQATPLTDFRRFEHVISPTYQRRIFLDTTLAELNAFDPQRVYAADPRYIVAIPPDASGLPLFEFYPAPIHKRIYKIVYKRQGIFPRTSDIDEVVPFFDKELIITAAKIKAYEWAMTADNTPLGRYGSKWSNLISMITNPGSPRGFSMLLEGAAQRDEELYPKEILLAYADLPFIDDLLQYGFIGETLVLNFGTTS